MATITKPKLSITRVNNKPDMRSAKVTCTISFDSIEVGQQFRLDIDLMGADKGFKGKDNVIFKMVNGRIIDGTRSELNFEESRRVSCDTLNEDSDGKDEIYALIEIKPKAENFGGVTPELKTEFEK